MRLHTRHAGTVALKMRRLATGRVNCCVLSSCSFDYSPCGARLPEPILAHSANTSKLHPNWNRFDQIDYQPFSNEHSIGHVFAFGFTVL
jgi:hypothetical protein